MFLGCLSHHRDSGFRLVTTCLTYRPAPDNKGPTYIHLACPEHCRDFQNAFVSFSVILIKSVGSCLPIMRLYPLPVIFHFDAIQHLTKPSWKGRPMSRGYHVYKTSVKLCIWQWHEKITMQGTLAPSEFSALIMAFEWCNMVSSLVVGESVPQ